MSSEPMALPQEPQTKTSSVMTRDTSSQLEVSSEAMILPSEPKTKMRSVLTRSASRHQAAIGSTRASVDHKSQQVVSMKTASSGSSASTMQGSTSGLPMSGATSDAIDSILGPRTTRFPTIAQRRTCRHQTYRFLIDSTGMPSRILSLSLVYQGLVLTAILVLVVLKSYAKEEEEVQGKPEPVEILISEWLVVGLWVCEHMLRFWCCVERKTEDLSPGLFLPMTSLHSVSPRAWYLLQPFFFADTLVLAQILWQRHFTETWLRGISVLRLARLLFLFGFERDINFVNPALRVFNTKKRELLTIIGVGNSVAWVSSVIVFYLEAPDNPRYNSLSESLWWAYTAMLTVGYGEITPVTVSGRILGSMVAFCGTGIIGMFGAVMSDGLIKMYKQQDQYTNDTIMAIVSEPSLAHSYEADVQVLRQQLERYDSRIEQKLSDLQIGGEDLEKRVDCLKERVHKSMDRLREVIGVLDPEQEQKGIPEEKE